MPDDKDKTTSSAPPKETAQDPAMALLGKAALATGMKFSDLGLVRLGKEILGEIPKSPSKFQK